MGRRYGKCDPSLWPKDRSEREGEERGEMFFSLSLIKTDLDLGTR